MDARAPPLDKEGLRRYSLYAMRVISLIAILIFASGCVHGTRALSSESSTVVFDANLLLPWTAAYQNRELAPPPILYEFTRGAKTLIYLASKHSNSSETLTFRFIKWVLENRKPDVLILEGFSTDLGPNPSAIVAEAQRGVKNGFYPSGEPAYAIELAIEGKIPFIGAEPSDQLLFQKIMQQGYSAEDILGFDFVRRVPQLLRAKTLDGKKLNEIFENYVKSKAQAYGYRGHLDTFDEFKRWYKLRQGKVFGQPAEVISPILI